MKKTVLIISLFTLMFCLKGYSSFKIDNVAFELDEATGEIELTLMCSNGGPLQRWMFFSTYDNIEFLAGGNMEISEGEDGEVSYYMMLLNSTPTTFERNFHIRVPMNEDLAEYEIYISSFVANYTIKLGELLYGSRNNSTTVAVENDAMVKIQTYCGGSTYNSNFGSASYLSASYTDGSYCASASTESSLLKFDVSGIPSNCYITKATLYLHPISAIGDNESVLRRVTGNWEESTVTFNSLPYFIDGSTSGNANNVVIPSIPSSETNNIAVTITDMVRYWHENRNRNFGVYLELSPEKSGPRQIRFASSENSNASFRPYVEIEYKTKESNCPIAADAAIVEQSYCGGSVTNTNFGNHRYFESGYKAPQTCATARKTKSLLKFDLSALSYSNLITAELILHPAVLEGKNTAYLYLVSEDWSEQSVTWQNRPATISSLGKVIYDTKVRLGYPLKIDATQWVKAWTQGTKPNFGIMIESAYSSTVNTMAFYSSNEPNVDLRPTLHVKYGGLKSFSIDTEGNIIGELEADESDMISVFPNPSSNYIVVDIPEAIENARRIVLIDKTGKTILTEECIQHQSNYMLNISSLASGNYILLIQTSEETYSKTIVVE